MEIKYKTVIQRVVIGGEELRLHVIGNFSSAVSDIEAALKAEGREDKSKDLVPYFGTVWEAARGLGHWLAAKPDSFFTGRKFVEIGCGLAIPSIVASKRGAKAIATDQHPDVPRFLNMNMKENAAQVAYHHLDWRDVAGKLLDPDTVIIGSDLIYDKAKALGVARFTSEALAAGVQAVVIADAGRPNRKDFVEACKAGGLLVSEETVQLAEKVERPVIHVMTVTIGK